MILLRPPLLLGLVGSMALASPAWSRLEETRGQCLARYGPPVAEVPALLEGATGATFLLDGIRVRIEFLDDKAAFISFSKKTLRQEERQKLLEVNGGPLVWNPPGEFLGRLCWTAPAASGATARHASAYAAADHSYMDFASDHWTQAMKAQQAVQFAILPKPNAPPAASAPGVPGPVSPAPSGILKGF